MLELKFSDLDKSLQEDLETHVCALLAIGRTENQIDSLFNLLL